MSSASVTVHLGINQCFSQFSETDTECMLCVVRECDVFPSPCKLDDVPLY